MEDHTPCFSKGRERSHMISGFLVMHPSGPFFSPSDAGYCHAANQFPSLSRSDGVKLS